MEERKRIDLPGLRWNWNRLRNDPETQFFLLSAFWFFLLVLGGFADTFYFSNSLTPSPMYIKAHGIAYSFWVLLYMLQSGLISSGNAKVHMLLGKGTIVVLIVLLITGYYTILYKASLGNKDIQDAGRNLFEIGLGVAIVLMAFFMRKKGYYHKRLMIAGMVMLTIAGVPRIIQGFWDFRIDEFMYYGLLFAPMIALVVFDMIYFGKVKFFSLVLLAIVFSMNYFDLHRIVFDPDRGDRIIQFLNRVFLWV